MNTKESNFAYHQLCALCTHMKGQGMIEPYVLILWFIASLNVCAPLLIYYIAPIYTLSFSLGLMPC